MSCCYNILVGKTTSSGSGDYTTYYTRKDKSEARKLFDQTVEEEKQHLDDWNLKGNEHLEIIFEKEFLNENKSEKIDVIQIYDN